jgi:hypothetical protein
MRGRKMENLKFKTSNLQLTIFWRKIWIVISLIILFITGCTKVSYEDVISCESPNWTSDGKVVFVREKEVWKVEEDIGVRTEIISDSTWLYEINSDGTGKENKGLLFVDTSFGGAGLSSAGDWVVFGDGDSNIWVVRRDGTSLQEVGEGSYPDFSPDASQIVYQKPNQGIWIMDRDGENDHQIISDTDVRYPAWSPDDTLIAYTRSDSLGIFISDMIGNLIVAWEGDSVRAVGDRLDWGPLDSNAVIIRGRKTPDYGFIIFKVDSSENYRFTNHDAFYYKWSPDGNKLIAHDANGWFIVDINGINKWYLQP